MFQKLTIIPTDETLDNLTYRIIKNDYQEIYNKLSNLYPDTYFTSYFVYDHAIRALEELSSYIDGMNCEENDMRTIETEYSRNGSNMDWLFTQNDYKETIGLVINVDSETHFNEYIWSGAVYLDGAAEALKTDPKKFMKIFHREDNPNLLFIWTNKILKPSQYFKAKVLQNQLNKNNLEHFNEYTELIYKAFEANDLNALNTVFEKFFKSDYIKEKEYKNFIKIFTNNRINNKKRLEQRIKDAYNKIKDYENLIANEGSRIEELNRELFAVMYNKKTDEDITELYNYLNKHRNITGFNLNQDNIILAFRAPIVYYTDYAIEKIIKNYSELSIHYKVLKLFLERKFELITDCRIAFYPRNFAIEAYYRSNVDEEIIGQPHIDQYGCLGNHREAINESAETEDYIGAIEQINQAVMNMNFYDACVANYLLKELTSEYVFDVKHTWMDKETGEMVTTAEAIRRSEL